MKKLSYILGCCVALFSCTREIEKIEPETIEYPNVAEENDLPTNIPSTLIANLAAEDSNADTKTAYVDSKSKWVMGDRVCLLYVDDLDTPTRQGWIAYSVTDLENNGRMATFTIVSGQDEKITALSSYHSTGVALYPSNAARPYTANTEAIDSDFGHKPFMTIQTTQTGNYADVVMLGKTAVVDGSTLTVDFKTAMSILKVSVSDIPAEAAKFQLYSSDADVYPTGDFLIDINADAPLELTKDSYHTWGGGYHSGSQAITINRTSEWDDGTQDFYLNVPTGSYSAGSITLKLLDGSDNLLMEKPIKSSFTFARNKMITGINLAAEWTTLGTGKFYDKTNIGSNNWSQFYHASVVVQQNVADGNTYRLINPYGTYWTRNGVSPEYSADNYLTFTVNRSTSLVTSFDNHKIGRNLDGSSNNVVIRHPSNGGVGAYYSGPQDASYNKVWQWNGDVPAVVQLAPIYCYSDFSNGWNKFNVNHLVEILFPGYAPEDVAIASDSVPTDESLHITVSGTNVSSAKAGCARWASFNSLSESFAPATGTSFSGFTGTGFFTRQITISAFNSDGTEIFHDYFERVVYSLSSEDASKIGGTYVHTVDDPSCIGGKKDTPPSSSSIVLIPSTDVFAGHIMISSFDGTAFTHGIPGTYSSPKLTFKNADLWKSNNRYLYTGSGPNVNDFVLQFVDTSTMDSLYPTTDFQYATTNVYPPTWLYWYRGGSSHVYTQE